MISNSEIITVEKAESKLFTDFSSIPSPDLLLISHPKLQYDSVSGSNPVQEYVDYRSSFEGGDFSPYVVDIYELYDQFSYGIPYHPFSVKNFINFIGGSWSELTHIFIIGKAIEYRLSRWEEDRISRNLIPTFGMPASDNLLMSDFGNYVPSYNIIQ